MEPKNFSFVLLQFLMLKAENKLNRGFTIMLTDDMSGEVADFNENGLDTVFRFANLNELFDKLLDLATFGN